MKEYVSTEELERQRIKPRQLVTFDSASDAAAFVEAAMPAPELIAFSEHGEHSVGHVEGVGFAVFDAHGRRVGSFETCEQALATIAAIWSK